MRLLQIIFLYLFLYGFLFSQVDSSAESFYPAHAGDIWQYRSAFTNEITLTTYVDKDSIDQFGNRFSWWRTGQVLKMDTSGNLYNVSYPDTTFLLYPFSAGIGTVWLLQASPWDSIFAKMIGTFSGIVFGKEVIIKKISFYRTTANIDSFWLGNEYFAIGFGMVQWDIEPSDVGYLAGAVINGVHYGTVVSIKRELTIPETFEVLTNYPNPFNNSTIISYSIAQQGNVNLIIYDVLGGKITTLVNQKMEKGKYEISFSGDNLTSGIYFVVLQTDSQILTHKILLLK
ncbi:MAG: T9SS type A sorting domain-containing protein [Bacteroidetes bacterium]|nr:T9SS type A sorting domain-containing protein [Bacteroidota bacterium]